MCLGGGGGPATFESFPPKDEGALKKWLNKLVEKAPSKDLQESLLKLLPAIVKSVYGAILCFLGKVVGFVAEHARALIFLFQGLQGYG